MGFLPRRAIGAVALVFGGLAVALALGEVIARLTYRAPMQLGSVPRPEGLPELKSAFELTRPGARGVYNGASYRSNNAGFRGREYTMPKPTGVFRIALAGDSISMGSGVREEETYAFLVEQGLNARGDRRYEVLNLGMIGLSIRGVLDRLEAIGLRFDPDLIVYGCTLNDILGPAFRSSAHPWAHLIRRVRYNRFIQSRSYLLRVLWPRWVSLGELLHPQPGSLLYELNDNYFNNPPAWSGFVAGLDRLAAIATREKLPAVVFIHTNLEYLNIFHPERHIYQQIAGAAEARGLGAIDSFAFHRGYDAESLWLTVLDAHPNHVGHALLAHALLDGLARLPDRYWRGRGPVPP